MSDDRDHDLLPPLSTPGDGDGDGYFARRAVPTLGSFPYATLAHTHMLWNPNAVRYAHTRGPRRRLALFDWNGTLVEPIHGDDQGYPLAADDWRLRPGRAEALAALHQRGDLTGICTNQAGVAFAYASYNNAMEIAQFGGDRAVLAARGQMRLWTEICRSADELSVAFVMACFTHPKATVKPLRLESNLDVFRKPASGMLRLAMLQLNVHADHTIFVGDRDEDAAAARRAGCGYMDAAHFFGDGVGMIPEWRMPLALDDAGEEGRP